MLVSASAKRPEGNAASDVGRLVKRVKLSADSPVEDKMDFPADSDGQLVEGTPAEDTGPSDLYLDTVGFPCLLPVLNFLIPYFRLTELSLILISRKSAQFLCQT